MSKQIRFFMTYDDEKDFLAAVENLGSMMLIRTTYSDEAHMRVSELEPANSVMRDGQFAFINREIQVSIKTTFFPSQSYYCVDLLESEAVEFTRSAPFKTWLNSGRLWFEEKTSDGKKSDAFVKSANALLRWIRTHYEKDSKGLYYVAPNALELSKVGKLQLGPPAQPPISSQDRKRILGLE